MKIVPAIDLIGGQCVRLSEGDFQTRKTYYEDPLEAAKAFERAGLDRLHLVDLDGARTGDVVHWDVLERIAANTALQVDFSGGIKTREAVQRAFALGAAQVAVGSLAVKQPETVIGWIGEFGAERIIIGADIKDGHIAVHGWQEVSTLTAEAFIETFSLAGARYFLCTDVSRDGRLAGPSTPLYRQLLARFPGIALLASGGVSCMDDLRELRTAGCYAAIVGKAIYEGRVGTDELAAFDAEAENLQKPG